MRDSTIIYRSFYEAIIELPKVNQAEVWGAIFEFSLNEKDIELKGISKTIFTLIKPQLEANIRRFKTGLENGLKGAEHGKKGGRPKKNNPQITPNNKINNPQITPKEPSNVNVNVNNNNNINQKEEPQQLLAFLTSDTQLELGAMACKTTLAAFTAYAKGKAGFLIATTEGKYSKQTLARIIIQDFEKVRNEFEVKTKIKVPEDFWSKSEYEAYCKQNNLESQWD